MLNIKEMIRLRTLIDESDYLDDETMDIRRKLSDMILLKRAWNAKRGIYVDDLQY